MTRDKRAIDQVRALVLAPIIGGSPLDPFYVFACVGGFAKKKKSAEVSD